MYQQILDAVVGRLGELFGETSPIYSETPDAGVTGPYLLARLSEMGETPLRGGRYCRESRVAIRYVPGEQAAAAREMNQAAERLMDGMERIALADGKGILGTERSAKPDWERQELEFSVTYRLWIRKQTEEEDSMNEIQIEKGKVE